jgi:hypothetical protein
VQLADQITARNKFEKKIYDVNEFKIMAYQHLSQDSGNATVYFEGDGLAFLPRGRISSDPTPINPIALKLAVLDKSENIIYLARPCQYVWSDKCQIEYWTSARFSQHVIEAYDELLNQIKAKYKLTGLNFVGFSGGAAIAILVASERNDVKQIITVAGNLDHKIVSQEHGVPELTESLSPADVANKVSNIPQLHLIGKDDRVVSINVFGSYQTGINNQGCISFQIIENATHETGWISLWPINPMEFPNCDLSN